MLNKIDKYIDNISIFIEKKHKIIFILILVLAIGLNTYKISKIPGGLMIDEAGLGYDAFCIANFGVDRYLNKFPLYFVNTGSGQSALYLYLVALMIKILGLNVLVIRLPALILSILEVIIAYKLVSKFKGKKLGLLFMFLITISPWHIMKSRWGLDAYILSPMLLFSVYMLLTALKENKRYLFLLAGILFGLTLYTYVLSYLIIPIMLLLICIYIIKIKLFDIRNMITFFVPLFILALPLIMMILIQLNIIKPIYSIITIPKLFNDRVSELSPQYLWYNIVTLKFVFGYDYLCYNSIPKYGNFYYFAIILLFVGFINSIDNYVYKRKEKKLNFDIIMLIYFISNLIIGLLIYCNTNKLNGIFIPSMYFICLAIQKLYAKRKVILPIIIMLYVICFISFVKTYFTTFSDVNSRMWDTSMFDLISYLEKDKDKDMYIVDIAYNPILYELYIERLSPYELNYLIRYNEDGNSIKEFGKYHYYYQHDDNNIKEDAIYIVSKNNTNFLNKLESMGFKYESFENQYLILQK